MGGRSRLAVLVASMVVAAALAGAAGAANFIVLYKGQSAPADAAATIAKAGGSAVYVYDQIGVAVASSTDASFRANMLKDKKVDEVSATAGFASRPPDTAADATAEAPSGLPNAPATDADSLSPLQWDMRQIHTPEAHAITGGSPAVIVGDIDTGIDFSHPDLAPNVDVGRSVNCTSGAPVPGLAAQDDNGHGTHTAGTIAAASNGIGIVGVAPNVRIAAIKAGNADGFFFPEAVICSFVWAASHQIDVTNNSYFADPWEYNCRNDPVQRAIWKAEQRAILYAEQQGVTVVAAEGNDSDDTAHPTMDVTSPDDTTPVERAITNACVIVPAEVPGVIAVTADGNAPQQPYGFLKSYYSSFGVGVTSVVAPGGDFFFGRSAEAPNGLVLSTWPSSIPCGRSVHEPTQPTTVYCYLQGTSMASPHVAGVAALVISRYGDLENAKSGKLAPGKVKATIEQTADPQPCPTFLPAAFQGRPYLAVLGVNSGAVQSCQGGPGYNSWYGHGQVNALSAVSQ
jgi:lantibiotic leader peptide-processing serine protease